MRLSFFLFGAEGDEHKLTGHSLAQPIYLNSFYFKDFKEKENSDSDSEKKENSEKEKKENFNPWFLYGSPIISRKKTMIFSPGVENRFSALWNLDPLVTTDFDIDVKFLLNKSELSSDDEIEEPERFGLFYLENDDAELMNLLHNDKKKTEKNLTVVKEILDFYDISLLKQFIKIKNTTNLNLEQLKKFVKKDHFAGFRKKLPFSGFASLIQLKDGELEIFTQPSGSELKLKNKKKIKLQKNRLANLKLTCKQDIVEVCLQEECLKVDYAFKPGGIFGLTSFSGKYSHKIEVFSVITTNFDQSHASEQAKSQTTYKILQDLTNLLHKNLKADKDQTETVDFLSHVLFEEHIVISDRDQEFNELYHIYDHLKNYTQIWRNFLEDLSLAKVSGGKKEDVRIQQMIKKYKVILKKVDEQMSVADKEHLNEVDKVKKIFEESAEASKVHKEALNRRKKHHENLEATNSFTIYLLIFILLLLSFVGLFAFKSLNKYERLHFH